MMPVATILKMPYLVRAALLTGVCALVVVGFLAIRVVVNHQGLAVVQSSASPSDSSAEDLEAQYHARVQEIITNYSNVARPDDPSLPKFTTQAQDQLLALKVPASQRDAHLALVLDFDAVKMAISENNSAGIASALSAISAQLKVNQ